MRRQIRDSFNPTDAPKTHSWLGLDNGDSADVAKLRAGFYIPGKKANSTETGDFLLRLANETYSHQDKMGILEERALEASAD